MSGAIFFENEEKSNQVRKIIHEVEPRSLRTYTPALTVLEKSEGWYHWTVDGKKLIDFTSGVLVHNLGYNPVGWWNRVMRYIGIDQIPRSGDFFQAVPLNHFGVLTELEKTAAVRLINNLQKYPGGARCQQVMWSVSGSEAVQKALWAALGYQQGKDIILATRYGFHGRKGLAGAVTGSEDDPERDPRVRFIGFPEKECRNIARRKEPIDLSPYQQELQAIKEECGDRISCLITEPYLGAFGSYHPQKEYLQLLESFCRENNILFILDEVQANFGRTGEMYAFTSYGVEPDIVCLGKGLGNGIPVAAAVGRKDVFTKMNYGIASDTYSGNPLSCAAVLATLDEFETGNTLEHARLLSEVVEKALSRFTEFDIVENIRGEGMVWGIECSGIDGYSANEVANACVKSCYLGDKKGRSIHLFGPLAEKVIRVSPPLVVSIAEMEEYLKVMYTIFEQLEKQMKNKRREK